VWYTVDEAAVIARRTPTALRQLRVKGRGPRFRKVDGRLLVSGSELRRWLSGGEDDLEPVPPSRLRRRSSASK
jgi:hypothetical protein